VIAPKPDVAGRAIFARQPEVLLEVQPGVERRDELDVLGVEHRERTQCLERQPSVASIGPRGADRPRRAIALTAAALGLAEV
jgi:hypothetical protein